MPHATTHHISKRKRIHQKKESYPHPHPWKKILDYLAYIASIITPMATLPQLWKIWSEKNADNVSEITWGAYVLVGLIFLTYSISHREWPLIIMYTSMVLIQAFIVLGIIIY